VFGGEQIKDGKLMRVSTVLQFRNDKLDESSIAGLLAKHELEHEP
jgi:hypothetical protein